MKAIRRFTVRTVLPPSVAPLGRLAKNLRWSWHRPTEELFAQLNPEAWRAVHGDPVKLLGSLTREEIAHVAQDPDVVRRVRELDEQLSDYLQRPLWYQKHHGTDGPRSIAYFCAEYGITSVLPQYSGGLGILAGDHLKTASDMGVPVVGVGLLYQAGYFKQSLSGDGWQQETYPVLDPDEMPLELLREADGTVARVSLELPDSRVLHAQIWRADVGRVPLLLLDSNVPDNDEHARAVTDRLYGGGSDHRLQQELLLGVGGIRALRCFSRLTGAPEPEVFHCNEGHAGFLGVERIRELLAPEDGKGALSWAEALTQVRAANVFTTHTPVPAGIDRFDRERVAHHVRAVFGHAIPLDDVLSLGAENYPGGDPATFNMAVMGLRLAQRANGVAALHGEVSRGMFQQLWRGFDVDEVPITSVTNGVHVPTWIDPAVAALVTGREHDGVAGPPARATNAASSTGAGADAEPEQQGTTATSWHGIYDVSDERLWRVRRRLRERLVHDVRARLRASWHRRGASDAQLGWIQDVLDPDVLTIGFARRVPTYKRLTLMLRDPERLKRLLLDPVRPVQLVIAGKSHPADDGGKRLIQDLVRFTDDPEVRHRIVFLPNYDMALARVLFPGCDVWLNNPLRPLEACGTSGMKAAINGGLNLSVLDGWWDEMYDGQNGWAIPTAETAVDENQRDDIEAAALYELLESHVAPRFYGQGGQTPGDPADHPPQQWLAMVKHTLATLGPKVSARRMLDDYVRRLYVPACDSGRRMAEEHARPARDLAAWVARVREAWPAVRVEHVEASGVALAPQIGDELGITAYVGLGSLDPQDVRVEVGYGRVSESDHIHERQHADLHTITALGDGRYTFSGPITIDRAGPFGYTVRVLPHHADLAHPAELGLVCNAAQ